MRRAPPALCRAKVPIDANESLVDDILGFALFFFGFTMQAVECSVSTLRCAVHGGVSPNLWRDAAPKAGDGATRETLLTGVGRAGCWECGAPEVGVAMGAYLECFECSCG